MIKVQIINTYIIHTTCEVLRSMSLFKVICHTFKCQSTLWIHVYTYMCVTLDIVKATAFILSKSYVYVVQILCQHDN